MVSDKAADRTFRIIKVPENTRACRADLNTGGIHVAGYPMVAPGTFVGDMELRVQITGAIRTGLNTVLATYAIIPVYQNNAVRCAEGCPGRADLDIGRTFAAIAQFGQKNA